MANVSFNNSTTGVNTDRVAASSKAFVKKNVDNNPAPDSQTFLPAPRRAVPNGENAPFVDVDGKRYYLNVPRGTYLNILV